MTSIKEYRIKEKQPAPNPPIYATPGFSSLEDAKAHLEKVKAQQTNSNVSYVTSFLK